MPQISLSGFYRLLADDPASPRLRGTPGEPLRVLPDGADDPVKPTAELEKRVFERPVRIEHVEFTCHVDLSECLFERSLRIEHCTFRRGLRLAHVHVRGRLSLKGCLFRDTRRRWLDFARLRVDGLLDATNVVALACLDMRNLRAGDSVWFNGLRAKSSLRTEQHLNAPIKACDDPGEKQIWRELQGVALYLHGSDIRRHFQLLHYDDTQAGVRGEIDLRATVGGNVLFANATISRERGIAINMDAAVVGGTVFFHPGTVVIGEVRLLHAKVGGQVNFSNARITRKDGIAIDMEKADVGGTVFVNDGTVVLGGVYLKYASVAGVLVSNALITREGGIAINMEKADVGGSVTFHQSVVMADGSPSSIDLEARIRGGVTFDSVVFFGNEIDMGGIGAGSNVVFDSAVILGWVNLGGRVARDVAFRDTLVLSDPGGHALLMESADVGRALLLRERAVFGGHVRLSGSTIEVGVFTTEVGVFTTGDPDRRAFARPAGDPSFGLEIFGDVDCQYLTVNGPVRCHSARIDGRADFEQAEIDGHVDFCGGTLGRSGCGTPAELHKLHKELWDRALETVRGLKPALGFPEDVNTGVIGIIEKHKERILDGLKRPPQGEAGAPAQNGQGTDKQENGQGTDKQENGQGTDEQGKLDDRENVQAALNLRMAGIKGRLWLKGQRVLGTLDADAARIEGEANFTGARIRGDLLLRSAVIEGRTFGSDDAQRAAEGALRRIFQNALHNQDLPDWETGFRCLCTFFLRTGSGSAWLYALLPHLEMFDALLQQPDRFAELLQQPALFAALLQQPALFAALLQQPGPPAQAAPAPRPAATPDAALGTVLSGIVGMMEEQFIAAVTKLSEQLPNNANQPDQNHPPAGWIVNVLRVLFANRDNVRSIPAVLEGVVASEHNPMVRGRIDLRRARLAEMGIRFKKDKQLESGEPYYIPDEILMDFATIGAIELDGPMPTHTRRDGTKLPKPRFSVHNLTFSELDVSRLDTEAWHGERLGKRPEGNAHDAPWYRRLDAFLSGLARAIVWFPTTDFFSWRDMLRAGIWLVLASGVLWLIMSTGAAGDSSITDPAIAWWIYVVLAVLFWHSGNAAGETVGTRVLWAGVAAMVPFGVLLLLCTRLDLFQTSAGYVVLGVYAGLCVVISRAFRSFSQRKQEQGQRTRHHRKLLDFLEGGTRFSRRFYIAVEKWKRGQGDDDLADEVFLSRRRRELWDVPQGHGKGFDQAQGQQGRGQQGGGQQGGGQQGGGQQGGGQQGGGRKERPRGAARPGFAHGAWAWFLDFTTGYGVRYSRLVHVYILLFLLSWAVFLHPCSVERPLDFEVVPTAARAAGDTGAAGGAGDEGRAGGGLPSRAGDHEGCREPADETREEPPGDRPDAPGGFEEALRRNMTRGGPNPWSGAGGRPGKGDGWGRQAAFFMAMRHHVPLLDLMMDQHWKPADRPLVQELPLHGRIPLRYDLYAAFMRAASLVLVPLIIAGATGFLKRGSEQLGA